VLKVSQFSDRPGPNRIRQGYVSKWNHVTICVSWLWKKSSSTGSCDFSYKAVQTIENKANFMSQALKIMWQKVQNRTWNQVFSPNGAQHCKNTWHLGCTFRCQIWRQIGSGTHTESKTAWAPRWRGTLLNSYRHGVFFDYIGTLPNQ